MEFEQQNRRFLDPIQVYTKSVPSPYQPRKQTNQIIIIKLSTLWEE